MIPFEVIALSPYARELLTELSSRKGTKRMRDDKERVIEVRAGQPEDSRALAALYDASLASGDWTRAFPLLSARQRGAWIEELTSGANIVARASSHVIGHAALLASDDNASRELVLLVHPEYRQAGIGRELLEWVLDAARRAGAARVWLRAEAGYACSATLFAQRGFQRDTERVPGRETWFLDLGGEWRQPWHVTERLVDATASALRVRLAALLRGVRIAMIPLVCALVIAAASEDPRGRVLGIILAVVSVLFGVGVQLPAIVSGQMRREGGAGGMVASTGEWTARLR